jgi:leucyl-tRNA synthetase
MQYDPKDIERKWREKWQADKTYQVLNDPAKPKYYVLDMFPYPSGAGLHVGHPLGYIASDIVSRYKRHNGFNVLHPMGYDSFGLPAEQYAIQTGQHPAKTTEVNIARYREQLDNIGFSFDWDREVRTSEPAYYKWTQWIFLQLFDSWYDHAAQQAKPIAELTARFATQGWTSTDACALTGDVEEELGAFTAAEWTAYDERTQQRILQQFRLAYLSEAWVNWCPALGTVLANDEVKDGVSERGGHPVERKRMPQWSMRITAYAQRLIDGLDTLDWSESIKEAQRNWIGRSEGALVRFALKNAPGHIEVFTTRPDTLFGVTFVTLAPEHELVEVITPAERRAEVLAYVTTAKNRSERDRMADVKKVSGVFTGATCIHPFTGQEVPVWVGDYVLGGYGTGAVMAVPGGDQRDWNFATHFGLPIIAVTEGADISKEADERKDAIICSEGFLKGLAVPDAITRAIDELVKLGAGERRINYRLRDAAFGRQRYWGEPIPIYYKDGVPYALPESELPLKLPEVDKFLPTAKKANHPGARRELELPRPSAGDHHHARLGRQQLVLPALHGPAQRGPLRLTRKPSTTGSRWTCTWAAASTPPATCSTVRFWTKFLHDRGWINFDEPAKKLVNQGMIQGVSAKAYRLLYGSMSWGDHVTDETDDPSHLTGPYMFISAELRADWLKNEEDVEVNRLIDHALERHAEHLTQVYGEFPFKLFCDGSAQLKTARKLVDISVLKEDGVSLDMEALPLKDAEFRGGTFITRDGVFRVDREVEKMSKSKFNVVNPDDIISKYGADTLRLYEMFLGPIEQSKPWDTNGIEGTFRFLRKFWNLFYESDVFSVSDEAPTKAEFKVLHATIKKVTEDIERMSVQHQREHSS